MSAVGEVHVQVVPDVSHFAERLRRIADVLDGASVVVRPEDYDVLVDEFGDDGYGSDVSRLHQRVRALIDNAYDPRAVT